MNGKLSVDFSDITSDPYYVRSEQLLLQPDSKILSAGFVTDNNGAEVALARFINTYPLNATAITLNHVNITATIYPNPATSVLNIKGLNTNNQYELSIVDAKGNIAATKQIGHPSLCNWNIQHLATGLYYVNISSGNKKATIQFIKQ